MHLLKHLIAIVSLLAAGMASATTLHVELDTSAYTGTGWLDLQFNPGLAPGTASVLNFSGALDAGVLNDGDVSGALPGVVVLRNSEELNAVFQAIVLGGVFSFDVDFAGGLDSAFALALYDATQSMALGSADPLSGALMRFDLGQGVTVYDAALVRAVVPEPSSWLLLLAGAAVLVLRLRTR